MGKPEENEYFNFHKKIGEKINKEYIKDFNPFIEIITVYSKNNINFQKTVNSLINQTFPYWKWTIINVADKQALNTIDNLDKDKRISVINQKDEINSIINKIIDETQCEFVYMLDQNSILDETVLECSYWSLKTNPEASWCYSNYVIDSSILQDELFMSETEKEKNIINSSYLIRKDDILQIGGFKTQDKNTNIDWNLFLKLLAKDKFPIRMDFYGTWNNKKEEIVTEEIVQESKNIKHRLMGINYPVGSDYWFDTAPFEFEFQWDEDNSRNTKTNLLFIFPWFRVGGADKFNYDLISNLDKSKYNITILTTEPCPYIWRQKFEDYAEIFDLTSFLHRKYWASFIDYIMKTRKINLVMNSNSYYGYYAIPWLKYKFPDVIFTDYLHAVNWNWRNGEYPVDSTAISRILDKTFVTSNQVKDIMQDEIGRKLSNTKVVYIGVNQEKFEKDNKDIKIDENILKYKSKFEGKKVLLFCCRISDEKRPILMVKILEELNKRRDDIILFVVGDGPQLREMKEMVENLKLQDKIIFFGMQEEVRPFYKLSNILVNCSIREGITLTTYEALSMSVPVVTANVGGQKELVDDSCGRIVSNIQKIEEGEKSRNYSQEEVDRYANAIEDVLDNKEYEVMRENCRKRIENKFTISKMVETMESEFDTLIKQKTQVPSDLINNEELYKNYLVLYNEIDRRYYNSAKGGIISETKLTLEQELKNQIEEYKQKIEQKNTEIQQERDIIEQKDQELKNIYGSKRWKYMEKILNILKKIKY